MSANIVRAEHQYECPDCRSRVRATCEVNQGLAEALDRLTNVAADTALILGSTPATTAHVDMSKQLQRAVVLAAAALAKAGLR